MAQYWGQGEGAGTGDTKRLKPGWGTDITEGIIFLAHPAKTRFSSCCEGQTGTGSSPEFQCRWGSQLGVAFHLLLRLDSRMPFPPLPAILCWVAAPGGRSCASRLDHWRAAQSQAPLALNFRQRGVAFRDRSLRWG